jgi:hypothetical protein
MQGVYRRSVEIGLWTLVVGCAFGAAQTPSQQPQLPVAPQTTVSPTNSQPQSAPPPDSHKSDTPVPGAGQVGGLVVDADADVVDDAEVALTRPGSSAVLKTQTDDDGHYVFKNVPPGTFTLTANAKGLTAATYTGLLHANEVFGAPTLHMGGKSVAASVEVTASTVDLAEAEVHVEEQQRIAGFMPNFFVTYDWNAAPLDTKQKFELSWHNTLDPANFAISAAIAGVQQARNDLSGFGQGAGGYGKRLAADTGDLLFGTFMGGFVFPTILHQDPRYFYKGTGSVVSRAFYAIAASVICRGDNGKWQPNYSSVLGDFSAGALSNLYYPSSNRNGATLTIENGFLDIAENAIGNVVQEFVFKKLTPHSANYNSASSGSSIP